MTPLTHAPQLESTLDAAEHRERGEARGDGYACMARRRDRRQRILLIVAALQRERREHALRRAAELDGAVNRDGPVGTSVADGSLGRPMREALDLAPAATREHAAQAGFAAVDDDPSVMRNRAHQVVKLRLDRGEIGKDVGVVVFEVVEDRGARAIVHELRTLVAERGVVFVGLDDEERAISKPCRDGKVDRHAADEESRREARTLQDPGEQRGSRGLAVGTGDGEHPLAGQHVLGEPLRSRRVGAAGVEDRFKQRIAARNRVADHEHVGVLRHAGQLRGIVALA